MEIDIDGSKSNGSDDYNRLRDQAREERQVRMQAERNMREAQDIAIANSLRAANLELEKIQKEQDDAYGDQEKLNQLSRRYLQVSHEIEQYQAGQAELRSRPVTQEEEVAAYIGKHSPQKQHYMRKHYSDLFEQGDADKKTGMFTAAHYDAIHRHGYAEDSPEYFRHIEEQMGYPAGGSYGGQTRVTLTKEEADFCRETGQDMAEYAKNKARLLSGDAGGLQYTSAKYGNFNPSSSMGR